MLKLKYYFEWLFYFLLFSAIAIFQSTFISSLPPAYFAINLPLTALLFSLLFFNRNMILVLAVFMGFWLDILGFNFFGMHIFVLLLIVFILDFILRNWLTNKSLYSFLMLSILSAIIYDFLVYILIAIWQNNNEFGIFFIQSYFWKQLLWQMLWNATFMVLFFNLANSLSKHLKPFFLEKK